MFRTSVETIKTGRRPFPGGSLGNATNQICPRRGWGNLEEADPITALPACQQASALLHRPAQLRRPVPTLDPLEPQHRKGSHSKHASARHTSSARFWLANRQQSFRTGRSATAVLPGRVCASEISELRGIAKPLLVPSGHGLSVSFLNALLRFSYTDQIFLIQTSQRALRWLLILGVDVVHDVGNRVEALPVGVLHLEFGEENLPRIVG